ncbi:MAG TPA: hypothetical protein VEU29_04450 [Actinomycetota bacterium]|nr:hypothetical protein [Actinomycetota bacterium]
MTAALAVAATVGIASPAGAQPQYCYTLDSCLSGHCYWWGLVQGQAPQVGNCNPVVLPEPLPAYWCDIPRVTEGCNFTDTSDPCTYVDCSRPECNVSPWLCSEPVQECLADPVSCLTLAPRAGQASGTLA